MSPPTSRTVRLRGHLSVPPARRDAVRAALPEHIRLSRAEPGCLHFDVHESTTSPGRFDVTEEFTDAHAFHTHQTRTRASDWARITAGIPRDYKVTGLEND